LFERIAAFLERFEVYARSKQLGVQVDVSLQRIIHELLRSFLRVCALSIKISKHSKVLLALEVFSFGSDKGVAAELQKLETLVQRETAMGVVLTLESAKHNENNTNAGFAETKRVLKITDAKVDGVSKDLGKVSGYFERREDAEKRKEAEKTANRDREMVKNALRIDKEPWHSKQEELLRDLVPNSGHWLIEHPQFSLWLEAKVGAAPILGLQAKEGFGKSFLCSTAIRHLNGLYPPSRQGSRVSVAYYFFEKDNKDSKSVNKALRAIIWQLAGGDAVYQRDVAAACNEPDNFGNTIEMWNQLVIQLSTKIDATFFVFLDGIDEAETEIGNPLIRMMQDVTRMWKEKRCLSLRLFVTGRPKIFTELESRSNIVVSTIGPSQHNREDVLRYIDMRMDNMDTMKNIDNREIRDLREHIRTKVAEGARGDFFMIKNILSEINGKKRRKEIEDVLEHAGENRLETIAREVERLNNTLSAEDIRDFNEILTWVIGAKLPPTIKTLESVLFLKNGEISLVPLEDQIDDKYSAFMKISEEHHVTTTSDSIAEYFKERATTSAEDAATKSRSVLHEAEVAIVRRFLKGVCDEELFQKFGFEEFFARKLIGKGANVDIDLESIHVQILHSCLKAIDAEPSPELESLLEYTYYWLPHHLDEVDLALTPPGPKRSLGSTLIKLFTNETFADRWWSPDKLQLRHGWVYDDSYCTTVLNWFKDSAVQKDFTIEQREWVQGLTSISKPDDDLLKPLAKIMAKRCAQTPNLYSPDIFWWLLGYVTKVSGCPCELFLISF
jgi:hypothetical protein